LISGGRGFELCRQLSERDGIPVLAISALDTRDNALAAGASVFLLKPIEPLHLVSAVQDLLGRSAFLHRDEHRAEITR
jgi:DNA-binding response OmpR family regulator